MKTSMTQGSKFKILAEAVGQGAHWSDYVVNYDKPLSNEWVSWIDGPFFKA